MKSPQNRAPVAAFAGNGELGKDFVGRGGATDAEKGIVVRRLFQIAGDDPPKLLRLLLVDGYADGGCLEGTLTSAEDVPKLAGIQDAEMTVLGVALGDFVKLALGQEVEDAVGRKSDAHVAANFATEPVGFRLGIRLGGFGAVEKMDFEGVLCE